MRACSSSPQSWRTSDGSSAVVITSVPASTSRRASSHCLDDSTASTTIEEPAAAGLGHPTAVVTPARVCPVRVCDTSTTSWSLFRANTEAVRRPTRPAPYTEIFTSVRSLKVRRVDLAPAAALRRSAVATKYPKDPGGQTRNDGSEHGPTKHGEHRLTLPRPTARPTGQACVMGERHQRDACNQVRSLFVGLGRVELPTSPLSGVRSNQLSYSPEQCGVILPASSDDTHHIFISVVGSVQPCSEYRMCSWAVSGAGDGSVG